MPISSANISWNGETVLMNNNATYWGGALYAIWYSNVFETGHSIFRNNSAYAAGGVVIYGYSVSFSHGTTLFEESTVGGKGAALDVHVRSNASWTGGTTFNDNTANRAGAIFVWKLDVSWTGNTTFVDTVANLVGGAVYTTVNIQIHCSGHKDIPQ